MNVYEIGSMEEKLSSNTYPGRGIVLGLTPDGKQAVAAYFIMGRSVNSRNRIFALEPDGIRTEAYDPSKMEDPIRHRGRALLVTNGDQTDTIREFLEKGKTMEEALRTRKFEHDGPNWTPRISGLLSPDGSYKMSILKASDPEGTGCNRYTYDYDPIPGLGHFLHTYMGDGSPLPTFTGEPERASIPNDIDAWTKEIWENLNEQNKISIYVRFTDLKTGAVENRMINKNA